MNYVFSENMGFPYIIKHNFVAKTWKLSFVFIILLTKCICLASVFGYFAIKAFEITVIIWRSDMDHTIRPRAAWNYICVHFPENNCKP